MARISPDDARHSKTIGYYISNLIGILVSGKNPDGTDYTMPVSVEGASVTLTVDELDNITNRPDTIIGTSTVLTIGTVAVPGTGVEVPAGTRLIYAYVPALTAGSHVPAYNVDGTNWVNAATEDMINQEEMPSTKTTGCRWGFQLPYVAGMRFRAHSSGDQTGKSIILVFCR